MKALSSEWFKRYESRITAAILLLGLGHALLYTWLMPPWQHYDEPTHFEYAWMIVDTGALPVPDEHDWEFRTELVRSLIEHDFYDGGGLRTPDPANISTNTAGLQQSQLDDPPLYYLLASLPLRLVQDADLAVQLRAARLFSVLLFLVTLAAAVGIMRQITPPGSRWRFLIPLTLVLLPGFVDLMTAVNSDVGAVAVFSLFLWGSVRLIQRGFNILDALWVLAAAAAAFYTKSTAYLAVPLAVVALVLGLLPGRFRKFAWLLVLAGALALAAGLTYLAEPAYWYRATSQAQPIRVVTAAAPHGEAALALDPLAEVTPSWLRAINQPLTLDSVAHLAGKTVTLGVWMWFEDDTSAAELRVRLPTINADILEGADPDFTQEAVLSRTPSFHAFSANIPADTVRLWVSLVPGMREGPPGLTIYYDAIVLAEGVHPLTEPPALDADGRRGEWGGAAFSNYVRNPSAEQIWPAFRVPADNFAARLLPSNVRPTILLYSVLDYDGAGWYYLGAGANIFDTFWGKFGWGHVPLPGGRAAYAVLGWLTALALIGVVVYPFHRSRALPVDVLLFFGLAIVGVWAATFARGAIFIFVDHVFIPSARYAFPAMIPTVLLLVAGWFGLAGYAVDRLRIPHRYLNALTIAGLVVLDLLAIRGIITFYA